MNTSWDAIFNFLLKGGALAGWFSLAWQVVLKIISGPKCSIVRKEVLKAYTSGAEYNIGVELLIRNKGDEGVSVDDILLKLKVDENWVEFKRNRQKINAEGNGFDDIPLIFDIDSRKSMRVWGIFQNCVKKNDLAPETEYEVVVCLSNGKTISTKGAGLKS